MTPNEFLDFMCNSSVDEFREFMITQSTQAFMTNMADTIFLTANIGVQMIESEGDTDVCYL